MRAGAAQAAILAAAALAAIAPAPATASGVKSIWGPTEVNGVSQFPLYQDLGVGIYQTTLDWAVTAPTRPRHPRDPRDAAYQWPVEVTHAVDAAGAAGIRVSLQIFGSPSWANGGHPPIWAPHAKEFASFAYAASREYRSVHLWMVWGEPSRVHNFEPETPAAPGTQLTRVQAGAPRTYARILDAGYGALKKASRRNIVIGGNTYTTGAISTRQWIENLRLPNGRPPRLDLYGHNPFSFRDPNLANPPSPNDQVDYSDLRRLAGWIDRYLGRRGGKPIKLFLSEFTIPTAPDSEFNFFVDRDVAARWLSDALAIMRGWPRIYSFGWIHLYDDGPGGSAGGLLDHSMQRKPSYLAYKNG